VNHRATLQYLRRIESGHSPIQERDELSEDQQWRERFVFGMRQRRGVAWEEFKASMPKPTGDAIESTLEKHIAHGWMERAGTYVRLTRSGLVLSDGLWGEYLAE
jgi:oxygen-independent coproporphyrinogen-3 oxidase